MYQDDFMVNYLIYGTSTKLIAFSLGHIYPNRVYCADVEVGKCEKELQNFLSVAIDIITRHVSSHWLISSF